VSARQRPRARTESAAVVRKTVRQLSAKPYITPIASADVGAALDRWLRTGAGCERCLAEQIVKIGV